jgi:hypothetical protein
MSLEYCCPRRYVRRSMPEATLLLAQILEPRQVRKRRGWKAALYQLRELGPDGCVEVLLRPRTEDAQKIAISRLLATARPRQVELLCTPTPDRRSVLVQVVCNWIPSECECGADLSDARDFKFFEWDCVCKSCCLCHEPPEFLQRRYGKWVIE